MEVFVVKKNVFRYKGQEVSLKQAREMRTEWIGRLFTMAEHDGVMAEAIRALGFDGAFVRDEGGFSFSALSDNALKKAGK